MVKEGIINEKVGLLHFDTEGHEFECLEGSRETIMRDRPTIMVETLTDNEFKKINMFFNSLGGYVSRTIDESCNVANKYSSCRNHIFEPTDKSVIIK